MTEATQKVMTGRMVRHEIAEFERIDRECFPTPWPAAEFARCIESADCVAIAARVGERSVGYGVMIFEWDTAHIMKLVVDEPYRRRGIGRTVLGELIRIATESGSEKIALEVRETNLGAQLFYRECGLRAVKIERGFYADTGEDAYLMERPLREAAAANGQPKGASG